jgi:hypothetical protein
MYNHLQDKNEIMKLTQQMVNLKTLGDQQRLWDKIEVIYKKCTSLTQDEINKDRSNYFNKLHPYCEGFLRDFVPESLSDLSENEICEGFSTLNEDDFKLVLKGNEASMKRYNNFIKFLAPKVSKISLKNDVMRLKMLVKTKAASNTPYDELLDLYLQKAPF